MTRQSVKMKIINALLKKAKFKLGPAEFEGPALLIYPAELILIGAIVAAVIVAVKRPDVITSIINAVL